MGCLLACFGFNTKKKGRKSRNINHLWNKEKPKEASISKVKKKVRFNLNVEAYEPIHKEEEISSYLSESEEEETKWEFNSETTSLMATLHYAQDSMSSRIKSYPQNRRYQNCSKDEIDANDDNEEDKGDHCGKRDKLEQLLGLKNEEIEGIGSDLYDKYRRKYAFTVLSPVENLSQWKVLKAKVAHLRPEKENIDVLEPSGDSFTLKNTRNSNISEA